MHYLPVNAVVLFVDGPDHGFIEVGERALFYAMDMELPRQGEPKEGQSAPIQGGPSKVGRRIMTTPKYAQDAIGKLGMRAAFDLWAKNGIGPTTTALYELSEIDRGNSNADVFVYKYIGDHSEVSPEKK